MEKNELGKQEILKSIEQLKSGETVIRTMEELEAMEEESIGEATSKTNL